MAVVLVLLILAFIILLVFVLLRKNGQSGEERERYENERLERKGEFGEEMVIETLERIRTYHVLLNDVYLRDSMGSHQIDHIYICSRGVFVLETKNISGSIYGYASSEKWRVYLGKGEYEIRNPVKQNQGHVNAINRATHNSIPLIPLVVFVEDNPPRKAKGTVGISGLRSRIFSYPETLDKERILRYAETIKRCIDTTLTKEEHIHNIEERERKIESGICPQCGGNLVVRHGRYGDFLGCSNYPRCKFKAKIGSRG